MIKTEITADCPLRRKLEILTNPIKQCTGKVFVQAKIMSTETNNIICTFISEPHSKIYLCTTASVKKHLHSCIRLDIYKPYLVCNGITAIVDNSYLDTTRMVNT